MEADEEMKDVKQSFMLPDDQCERLHRNEYTGLKMLLAFVSISAYAREDLQKRLECVPHGKERMNMAVGGLRSVCNDLIGTVSRAQCRQIMGTMRDYDVRLIPKLTPGSTNIIMTREAGKELIDLAREKCHGCTEDGDSCRKCRLYKILEGTTPLDSYGSGLICPYSLAEWE
jgi:hypothetical protein